MLPGSYYSHNIPPAKHNKGVVIQVADQNNALFRSDGEYWVPLAAVEAPEGATFVTASTTPSGGVEKCVVGNDAFSIVRIYPLYQIVDGLGETEYGATLMGSLAANTTASQSGNTVTVICGGASPTAHNLTPSENGSRVFFPGSSNIPKGIYQNFTRVDANTYTFFRAYSASIAAELVNDGAPYISKQSIAYFPLRANSLGKNGRLTLVSLKGGTATPSSVRIVIGDVEFSTSTTNTSAFGEIRQTVRNSGMESKQSSTATSDGITSSTGLIRGTVDTAIDQIVTVTFQCSAAQGAIWMPSAEIEIVYR